jgi:hypothetical protein
VFNIRATLDEALAELNCWRNSIHVAIRLKVQSVFLRAASLTSDKCENVQNRGNTANVARNTNESVFHAGMVVRQGFNTFAHTPQPVNFQQKVLESRSHCRSIGFRVYRVRCVCGQLCPDINLKAQIFYQAQRCCLAKEGKKQPEQVRNQIDSRLAVLIRVRLYSTSSSPRKPPFAVTCTALSRGDSDLARAKAREART